MDERHRSVWLLGSGAVVAAAVSAAVVAVDGNGEIGGGFLRRHLTIYGPPQAALALALGLVGLLLIVARRRVAVIASLGVTGLCAAQLAGAGFVAVRRWPLYWGCCSPRHVSDRVLVRDLAAGMALACAVVAVACVVVLAWQGYLGWHGGGVAVAFPVALAMAIVGPGLMMGGWEDQRALAAWALMYSLPFAAGLAVSALMPRFAALAVTGSVACSALVATVGESFLEVTQPWGHAQGVVVLAAVAVAAPRLFSRES
jgi:hypothetical protein